MSIESTIVLQVLLFVQTEGFNAAVQKHLQDLVWESLKSLGCSEGQLPHRVFGNIILVVP